MPNRSIYIITCRLSLKMCSGNCSETGMTGRIELLHHLLQTDLSYPNGQIIFKTGANDLYNRLPSSVQDIGATNNNVQEPSWYNLSRLEINWFWVLSRSICFMLCVVFLHVAGFGIKTKKIWFVMDWRICTFVVSFGVLQGPYNYVRHLLSRDRILFTGVFFSSVF